MFATVSAGEQVEISASSAKAVDYHTASNWFWGLNQVVGFALPLLLMVTGWGAHLYELASRISTQRRVVSLASFAAIFFLLDRLVRLPIRYLWDRTYDHASGVQSEDPAIVFSGPTFETEDLRKDYEEKRIICSECSATEWWWSATRRVARVATPSA